MSTKETRITMNGSIRAFGSGESQGDEMALACRCITYGALSEPNVPGVGMRERIMPGCFDDSIDDDDNDILSTFQHDNGRILGRRSNRTLKITNDRAGLSFRVKLDPTVMWHRDLHAQGET